MNHFWKVQVSDQVRVATLFSLRCPASKPAGKVFLVADGHYLPSGDAGSSRKDTLGWELGFHDFGNISGTHSQSFSCTVN